MYRTKRNPGPGQTTRGYNALQTPGRHPDLTAVALVHDPLPDATSGPPRHHDTRMTFPATDPEQGPLPRLHDIPMRPYTS